MPRVPLVEFGPTDPDACCASLAPNRSCAAAGYPSGAVALYDLEAGQLRWRASPLGLGQPVAGVAVLQRLRATRVMVVYRWADAGAAGRASLPSLWTIAGCSKR